MDSILQIIKARGIIIALILVTAIFLILLFLFPQLWQKETFPEEVVSPEQEEIKQQLEELDALREQSQQETFTEEDIRKQLEELDALRLQSAE